MADRPTSVEDLRPASYNPREIDAASFEALEQSLGEFGDISGITWNLRTGSLVTGHQRVKALREQHEDALEIVTEDDETWLVADGERFRIRVVDWNDAKERAANIAANSPMLTGRFTEDVEDLLADVEASMPVWVSSMRFDDLARELGFDPPDFSPTTPDSQGRLDKRNSVECPNCGHEFEPS